MTQAIELKSVSKIYKQGGAEIRALDAVTLSVRKGQLLAVMGASGSGKSTMLHLMAGLTTPSEGEVILDGKDISKMNDTQLTRFRREHIGLIFQAFNLLPTLTALENVSLPAMIQGKRMKEVQDHAANLLAQVGMSDRAKHRPDELSGGQQQRVAIARALMVNAPILLADEPTGNLDSNTGEDVLMLMKALVRDGNCTIVMVTHDPKAAAYADQIITLKDGRVLETLAYDASLSL